MFKFFDKFRNLVPPLSLSRFNLMCAIWLAVGGNFIFYNKAYFYANDNGLPKSLWIVIVTVCLVAYFNFWLQVFQWKYSAKIMSSILIIIAGIASYFSNNFGVYISPEQIQNVMQTDSAEVMQLITSYFWYWCVLFIFLPLLLVWITPIKPESFTSRLKAKLLHIIVSIAILLVLILSNYLNFVHLFREHKEMRYLISPHNVLNSGYIYLGHLNIEQKPIQPYGTDAHLSYKANHEAKPRMMVLVVGEAARAESFSLNGYRRNTNPKLSLRKDLLNFSQIYSCGTSTAVSVPCMFSGMPRKNYKPDVAAHREGLLDIVQRVGYKVTWIDNDSGCKGVCDRVDQIEISKSLKEQYCKDDGFCLDDVLLESFKSYLASIPASDRTPQVVVLHQRGSHGPAYYNRTTPAFSPFQPICNSSSLQDCTHTEIVNSYDNTIVYTDHILDQILQILEKDQRYQTGFWYLSDHGESTGERGEYLHGTTYLIAPSQQKHIPMMMWFSPQWRESSSDKVDCLFKQQHHILSQDNLFPTFLSLLDIQTETKDPVNDMLKKCQNRV
nr:phosphoethanolamine--lipid A transferase [Acinetobacter sp. Marseille-Q1620]